jgi:hypothetical protein
MSTPTDQNSPAAFFKFDVSKYKTTSAVPFNIKNNHIFSEFEFIAIGSKLEKLDFMFRCLCTVDRTLAFTFVDNVSKQLEYHVENLEYALEAITEYYTDYYADEASLKHFLPNSSQADVDCDVA